MPPQSHPGCQSDISLPYPNPQQHLEKQLVSTMWQVAMDLWKSFFNPLIKMSQCTTLLSLSFPAEFWMYRRMEILCDTAGQHLTVLDSSNSEWLASYLIASVWIWHCFQSCLSAFSAGSCVYKKQNNTGEKNMLFCLFSTVLCTKKQNWFWQIFGNIRHSQVVQ